MIKKIKSHVNAIIDKKLDAVYRNQKLLQQTNFDYIQISNLFSQDHFIPFSSWSISPSTISHVLNDIIINKRKNIVEFGAGASTFYIAKLIKTLKLDANFFSVESNETWVRELRIQLEILDIHKFVTIIYAPIVNEIPTNLLYKKQKKWYDTRVLDKELKKVRIDLILVDGPVGISTPFARYSAIPFLCNYLSDDFSIFLDDVSRTDEKEISSVWKETLDCEIYYFGGYVLFTTSQGFDVTPYQLSS